MSLVPFFLQGYATPVGSTVKIPFVTLARVSVYVQVHLFVLATMIYCLSGKMNVLAVRMLCDQGLGERILSGKGSQCVVQFSLDVDTLSLYLYTSSRIQL